MSFENVKMGSQCRVSFSQSANAKNRSIAKKSNHKLAPYLSAANGTSVVVVDLLVLDTSLVYFWVHFWFKSGLGPV